MDAKRRRALMLRAGIAFVGALLVLSLIAVLIRHRPPKTKTAAADLLGDNSGWTVTRIDRAEGVFFLRFRPDMKLELDRGGYSELLTIIWEYAPENSGAAPDAATSDEMARFENLLVPAVEHDGRALLGAVLTSAGRRQWFFYTGDPDDVGRRLSAMPDFHGRAYPIQLETRSDPTWSYVRDSVIGNR